MGDTVVEVNECCVFATTLGANWWVQYLLANPPERFTVIRASIGGDLVHVACDNRDDAVRLRDHMIESGLPMRAVHVRVLSGPAVRGRSRSRLAQLAEARS